MPDRTAAGTGTRLAADRRPGHRRGCRRDRTHPRGRVREHVDGERPGQHAGHRRRLQVRARGQLVASCRRSRRRPNRSRPATATAGTPRRCRWAKAWSTPKARTPTRAPPTSDGSSPTRCTCRAPTTPAKPTSLTLDPALARRQPEPVRRRGAHAAAGGVPAARIDLRHDRGLQRRPVVLRRRPGRLLGRLAPARRGLRPEPRHDRDVGLLDGRLRLLQAGARIPRPVRPGDAAGGTGDLRHARDPADRKRRRRHRMHQRRQHHPADRQRQVDPLRDDLRGDRRARPVHRRPRTGRSLQQARLPLLRGPVPGRGPHGVRAPERLRAGNLAARAPCSASKPRARSPSPGIRTSTRARSGSAPAATTGSAR